MAKNQEIPDRPDKSDEFRRELEAKIEKVNDRTDSKVSFHWFIPIITFLVLLVGGFLSFIFYRLDSVRDRLIVIESIVERLPRK